MLQGVRSESLVVMFIENSIDFVRETIYIYKMISYLKKKKNVYFIGVKMIFFEYTLRIIYLFTVIIYSFFGIKKFI